MKLAQGHADIFDDTTHDTATMRNHVALLHYVCRVTSVLIFKLFADGFGVTVTSAELYFHKLYA